MNSNKRFWLLVALTVTSLVSVGLIAELTLAALRISKLFSLCLFAERAWCGLSPVAAFMVLGSWLTVVWVWWYAARLTQRDVMLDAVVEVVLFVLPQILLVSSSLVLINIVSLLHQAFWKEPLILCIVASQIGLSVLLVKMTKKILWQRSARGRQD